MKIVKKVLKRFIILVIVGILYLPLLLLYLITGTYDILRHKKNIAPVFKRYMKNGTLTWIFSPLNCLIDIITLPYTNKQIYQLNDLPKKYQAEINEIIQHCPSAQIISTVENDNKSVDRKMRLYKWYGLNNKKASDCALFHRKFKYILTIGISTFSKNTHTSKHFGWLRAGIRVLYNIDPILQDDAYIIVNGKTHNWKKGGRLFIFDDTIMHQSFNLTDYARHCLFIDIVRPSLMPVVLIHLIKLLGMISVYIPWFGKSSNWYIER